MSFREQSEERDRERRRNRSRSRSRSPRGGRRRGGDRDSPGRGSHSKMVYISNIPYDVRWMELKDLIREKAGDVAYVEMLDGQDGKPKGCAVIEFKDRDMAVKCVEGMNRMPLKDRSLVVKEIREPERFFRKVKEETGVDFMANRSGFQGYIGTMGSNGSGNGGGGGGGSLSGGRDEAPARINYETYGLSPNFLKQLGIEGPLCCRVFAANLPYHVGPSKLKEVFGLAGNVADVDLQLDNTGKNKGLAVIEYTHPIEAVQAISMLHNQKFHDRSVTVKMDKFDKPQEVRRPGELPAGLKSIGMGLGANGAPLVNVAQLLGGASGTNGNQTAVTQTTNFGNTSSSLGYGSGTAALFPTSTNVSGSALPTAGSLSNFGTSALTSGGGVTGGGGLYGGAGLTGLLSGGGGNIGIGTGGMNSSPWNGSNSLSAFGGTSGLAALDGGSASVFRGTGGTGLLGSSAAGAYDRLRDYERAISPNVRQARSIIIRNLPLDYSWQTLRDRLRGLGDVEYADICSPGVGRVRFKTSTDAEKAALNLHGLVVEGHPITVDLSASE